MNDACFYDFPELKGRKVILKRITSAHLNDFGEFAYKDGKPIKKEESAQVLALLDEEYQALKGISWGVFYQNKLIGSIGFYRGFKNNCGEVGYVMNKAFRDQGFMGEAINLVCDFGFNEMKLNFIQAFTEVNNFASVRLLEKNNFVNTNKTYEIYTIFERLT